MSLGNAPNPHLLSVKIGFNYNLKLSGFFQNIVDRVVMWLIINWMLKLSFRWYLKGWQLIRSSTGDQSENCFFYPFSSEIFCWLMQQLLLRANDE